VRLEDLPGVSSDAFTVMNVADDDALGWATITHGNQEIVMATAGGQAIRFSEEEVRAMGLPAGGVMGIKLAGDADGVIAMMAAEANGYLWSVTDDGLAKATAMSEYPVQGRNGQGVINLRLPQESTEVVAAVIGSDTSEVIVVNSQGGIKRTRIGDCKLGSRSIKPAPLMKVGQQSRITGALRLETRPDVPDGNADSPRQLALLED
jgi:DNA gyrase subunit A